MLLHRASFKVMIWNGFPELAGKELKLRYTGGGSFGTFCCVLASMPAQHELIYIIPSD